MAAFRIERVDLRVADADRSATYYAHLTGLDRDVGGLLRFQAEGVRPEPSPRHATGLFHTALRFSTRAGLRDALRRIRDGGLELTGASDHGVSEAIYLRDPDDLGVELYIDRPQADWPRRADGGIDMYSIPLDLEPILAAPDEGEPVVDIGHVHLKASRLEDTVAFWTRTVGLEVTVAGREAAFMARDGYHHHVGANVWGSRGGPPTPPELPGLERVVFSGAGLAAEHVTPEGFTADLRP